MQKTKAFTLVELMIVVIIVSIIAGFGIPNFTKTINRAKAKDAINNLSIIHASNIIYRARNGLNLAGANDISAINSSLGINIIANGTSYACTNGSTCTASGSGFTATAKFDSSLGTDWLGTANPLCTGIDCP